MLDEENPGPSQIVFQGKGREDQALPVPETSIPDVVVDGTKYKNETTGGCLLIPAITADFHVGPCASPEEDTGNTAEGEGEPAGLLRGACQWHCVICPIANSYQSPQKAVNTVLQ